MTALLVDARQGSVKARSTLRFVRLNCYMYVHVHSREIDMEVEQGALIRLVYKGFCMSSMLSFLLAGGCPHLVFNVCLRLSEAVWQNDDLSSAA